MVKQMCRAFLGFAATEIPASELGRRAVVFSPHPDDESLGCGGTIIKKKMAGARVTLVFMTDGGAPTHGALISKEELKAVRKSEALNASRVLGLSVSDTRFLQFEDGRLTANSARATECVTEVLGEEQPEEVFIPYSREPIYQAADHIATTNIVLSALARHQSDMTLWEYPVWFWLHWPWVRLRQDDACIVATGAVLRNSIHAFFGLRAFTDLRYSVNISQVMELKRAAIAQHKSQVEQLIKSPLWLTLQDIARGEFLECLTTNREFFCRYGYHALSSTPGSDSQRGAARPGRRFAITA